MKLHINQVIISCVLTAVISILLTLLIQKDGWEMLIVAPFMYTPVLVFLSIALNAQNKNKDN